MLGFSLCVCASVRWFMVALIWCIYTAMYTYIYRLSIGNWMQLCVGYLYGVFLAPSFVHHRSPFTAHRSPGCLHAPNRHHYFTLQIKWKTKNLSFFWAVVFRAMRYCRRLLFAWIIINTVSLRFGWMCMRVCVFQCCCCSFSSSDFYFFCSCWSNLTFSSIEFYRIASRAYPTLVAL